MSKASSVANKKLSSPGKKAARAKKKKTASVKKKSSAKKAAAKKKSPAKKAVKKSASMKEIENKHGFDLVAEANRLEALSPQERVAWALETFPGKIAMSSSFGAQSAVSLHMMTQQYPDIPVILVDTGYFFAETYRFIEELTDRLKLNLQIYSNPLTPAWQEAKYGKLWEEGVDGIKQYNDMNKVEPMNRALNDLKIDALFSGLRRQQSSTREKMPVVVSQRGRVKVHPIVDWTDMDVGMYLVDNKLPYHPLWDEGYVSIGDWHTTRKLTDGMTAEDTRFFGLKRECGLNEDVDFQI